MVITFFLVQTPNWNAKQMPFSDAYHACYIVLGSPRTKSKVKRKSELGNGQIQGQEKVSTPASQETKQMLITLASQPSKESDVLQQHDDFVTRLGFTDSKKLIVVICILAVLVLIQTGIIITLSSSSKVQYVPISLQKRATVYYESFAGNSQRRDLTWLEDSARLLEEEINIAEARIESLQNSLGILKSNFKLVEKSVYNSGLAPEITWNPS